PGLPSAGADAGREVLGHSLGYEELRVLGPPVRALAQNDLVLAERLAVGRRGVLSVRGAVSDVTVEDDERGTPRRLAEDAERMLDPVDVVRVTHAQNVPSVAHEPSGDVLGERDPRVALDGDVIVVPDPAEVIEAEVAREGRGLRRDALHQTAVAADGVDAVIEH